MPIKWTNKLGLNDAIAAAIMNDPYNRGDSDFTATELIKPPRIRALEKRHENEITLDVSDHIYSLNGQAIHHILERANVGATVEVRYYTEVGGYRISCQIDHLENGVLSDYKNCSVYKAKKGADISDYIQQMNIQKFICEENGKDIHKLQIVALLRDWSKTKLFRSKQINEDYPEMQVVVLDIPVWKTQETKEFILRRIQLHLDAEKELPRCSDKETWAKPNAYAIKKEGRYSAMRLLNTEEDARAFVSALPDKKGITIELRPGEAPRCDFYCVVGAHGFCEQKNKRDGK